MVGDITTMEQQRSVCVLVVVVVVVEKGVCVCCCCCCYQKYKRAQGMSPTGTDDVCVCSWTGTVF